MSAPRIPNLNTLRSRAALSRGRGRGSGRAGFGAPYDDSDPRIDDKVVQQTDEDASVSRLSAVEVGYLDDPFAKAFVQNDTPRRYPIINRGTYVRTTAIDSLVESFLQQRPSEPKQILSLGAGSDTRYFRLQARFPSVSLRYHEVDFPTNTTQKIASIRSSQPLKDAVGSFTLSMQETCLISPTYNIHPLDLRTLVTDGGLDRGDSEAHQQQNSIFQLQNLSAETPTLILSECCLVYLPAATADAALGHITRAFLHRQCPLAMILYEPIRPNDAFGRVMISNLATRGIVLQTLKKYGSLMRQQRRLQLTGFTDGQGAADVNFIWENWVADAEKERVSRVEMLDEVEEWQLLAQHYCVAWGWQNGRGDAADVFQQAWANVERQQESDDEMT